MSKSEPCNQLGSRNMTLCHVYIGNYVRLTTIFVATPKDENQRPKTLPDFESAVSDNIVPHAFVRHHPSNGCGHFHYVYYMYKP